MTIRTPSIKQNTDEGIIPEKIPSAGLLKAHISPQKPVLTSYKGGSLSKLSFPKESNKVSGESARKGGGGRKAVKGLSNPSRLRFLREMARIDFSKIKGRGLFVTLTYPQDEWPPDPKLWKRQRQKFNQRLERKYGKIAGFWRLELRGKDGSFNPHFHMFLVLDMPRISNKALADIRAFAANAWYEVCGKVDDDHLLAGTQVKRVGSRRDWDRLTRYVGKKEKLQDESLCTGRVWGIWGKDLLPIEREVVEVEMEDAFKLRRWVRRLAGKKRGVGPLLQQHVFIRYDENLTRVLNYLDKSDKSAHVPRLSALRTSTSPPEKVTSRSSCSILI
jgi:hypothetical protein